MNENLLKTLMSRINFTSLEEFEDVLEEFLPAIDMNLYEFLELKYDESLCLKDFDLGTFIQQYKNDPVQILTSLIFWNKDNMKLNTLFEKWDKQDYIFSKYDTDTNCVEDTENQSIKI